MESTGGGKMRPKRSHGASKPYQRNRPRSLLDRVKDLVTPSWLSNMWGSGGDPEGSPSQDHVSAGHAPATSAANSITPAGPALGRTFEAAASTTTTMTTEPQPRPPQAKRARVVEQGDERARTPLMPFSGQSAPVGTSTPIDVDEEIIDIDSGEGPSTQKDDVSEMSVSAPPSVVSSLYPNLDKLEHQQKLSESNLDMLSDMGHRRSPMPSSGGLWSHTPLGRSATTRARPASPFNRPQPPAIATRRPAFNTSYFGTPRGTVRTSSPLDSSSTSPFYPGRTTYGGASAQRTGAAAKRPRNSPYEVHLPIKRSVRPRLAKPSEEGDMGVTSNTAKRILDTLEKMSTPLSDAKRIPLSPTASPLAFRASRTPKPKPVGSPHRPLGLTTRGVRIPGPPVSGLSIPHTVSIAPNRQPAAPPASALAPRDGPPETETSLPTSKRDAGGADSDRPTAMSSFSFKGSVAASTNLPEPVSAAYSTPVQSSYDSSSSSQPKATSGGKMKQKRSAMHYSASRDNEDDVVEVPNLPQVSLPIKTLPTFNFGKPLLPPASSSSSSSSSAKTIAQMSSFGAAAASSSSSPGRGRMPVASTPAFGQAAAAASKDGDHEFTFASPILKQSASTIAAPEFEASEAFEFSMPKKADVAAAKPLNFVNPSSVGSGGRRLPPAAPSRPIEPVMSPTQSQKGKEEEEEEDSSSSFGIKAAKTLKTGSCLEVFGIVPSAESKSTAAASSSSSSSASPAVDVFAKLRPPPAKPSGSGPAKSGNSPAAPFKSNNSAVPTSATNTTSSSSASFNSDLMAKFRPPEGAWDCSVCLLQNKKEAAKCVACESPAPAQSQKSAVAAAAPPPLLNNSLKDKFKPPPGSWQCGTCLLQNKPEAKGCIACSAPNPNPNPNPNNPSTTTAQPANTALTNSDAPGSNRSDSLASAPAKGSLLDKFKPPPGSWDCDTCLIQNKATADRCIACETPKPGSQPTLKSPPTSAFKFGGQSTTTSSSSSGGFPSGDFKFGGGSSAPLKAPSGGFSLPSGMFTFGAPKPSDSEESGGLSYPKKGFLSSSSSSQGFKFGRKPDTEAKTNSSSLPDSSAVEFGLDAARENDSAPKVGSLTSLTPEPSKLASSTPAVSGFQFGAPKTTTGTTAAPPNTDPFKAAAVTSAPTLGAAFAVNAVNTVAAANTSTTSSTQGTDSASALPKGFSFGSSQADSPKLNLGSAEAKDVGAAFTFGAKPATDSASQQPTASPATFKFGGNASTPNDMPSSAPLQSTEKSVFKFGGAPSESTDVGNKPASSGFTFGAKATPNALDAAPALTSAQPHQNSVVATFQFGKSNAGTDEAGTGQAVAKPALNFTSAVEQNPAKENKSTFNFGGVSSQPAAKSAAPFVFGAAEHKDEPSSKPNGGLMFGAPSQSLAPAQSEQPFAFGAAANNSKPSGFNFSASTNQNAAMASFQFGASAATSSAPAPIQQNPPAFGGFSSAAPSTNATFAPTFGTQPAANSTAPAPFGGQQPTPAAAAAPAFGAPTAASVFGAAAATPAFGTVASAGSSRSSTPTFGAAGATNAAPAFGSTAASGFGAAAATNSAIGFQPEATPSFNFGASNANPTSSVFAFGANNSQNAVAAPQTAATGGFSFGQQPQQQPQQQQQQQQQQPQQSGFGVQNATGGAPGVFSFGAGQTQSPGTAFNFGAAGNQQRKIRKAVRRTRKT